MSNSVTFYRSVDKFGNTEYMSARVRLPNGKEYHVGYHPNIGADGQRDGINFAFSGNWINGVFVEAPIYSDDNWAIWLEDRNSEDMFCSEFFQSLTGRYPYEVEEHVPGNQDYIPFPGDIK